MLVKTISFDVVHVGEALGLYHALEWLRDMQFDNVDFEINSKITHDAFHSHKDDVSEFGHIISACQSLFTNHFTNSRAKFTRRQANAVTHALAGETTLLTSSIIYFRVNRLLPPVISAPCCINNVVFNEML